MDRLALDAREVHRLVERADDAVVAVGETVLDVIEGGVDEDPVVVPRSTLYSYCLVDCALLL